MTPVEEHILFYHELGMAISQWAQVEMALRDVVVNTMPRADRRKLSVGFYSIENFRSKLQFCDNLLVEAFDGTAHLADWPKLQDRLSKSATKRNKIAHRTVVTYASGSPGRRYALVEWLTEQFSARSRKQRFLTAGKPPQGALCLLDVIHIRYEFFSLLTDLSNFAAKLAGTALPFDQATFPVSKPPTLAEYRRQMRGLLHAASQSGTNAA
jgi:hypothetical protein